MRVRDVVIQLLVSFSIALVVSLASIGIKQYIDNAFWADVVSNMVIIVGVPLAVWRVYRVVPTRLLDKNRMFDDEPFVEKADVTRYAQERKQARTLSLEALQRLPTLRSSGSKPTLAAI